MKILYYLAKLLYDEYDMYKSHNQKMSYKEI
jgi:hypothetical protein